MKKRDVKFLKELVETPSPTGSEEKVAELVRQRLSGIADEIHTDTMGSVHAILSSHLSVVQDEMDVEDARVSAFEDAGEYEYVEEDPIVSGDVVQMASPVFMLAAHMDEIGLMVRYISDEGFLSISAIGGVDAAILPGMRVDVHGSEGVLRGVVGRKPIHLISADERKTVTPLDDLVIDLGLPAHKVKRLVSVGDSITFGVGFERFGRDMAVSKSFDDKSGVFIACEVMERLAETDQMQGTYIAAITTQEEIGTRGATTSAYSVNPDVAVAFDVTHATDYPGIDRRKHGDIRLGAGPVIAKGPNINPLVFERLVAAAEAESIPYQLEAEPGVTGTDARAIQISQSGIPTGLVSIPLRYMHTPNETVCLSDIEDTIRLLVRFALDLEADASFVPGISPAVERPHAARKEKKPLDAERELKKMTAKIQKLAARIAELEDENSQMSTVQRAQIELFEKMRREQDDDGLDPAPADGEEETEAVEEEVTEEASEASAAAVEASLHPEMRPQMNNPRFAQGYGPMPPQGWGGMPYAEAPYERQPYPRGAEFPAGAMPQQGWAPQPNAQQPVPRSTFANPAAAEEAAQGIIPGKDTLTIIPTDAEEE